MPKVYATKNIVPVALFMSLPILLLEKIFRPVTSVLIFSTSFVKRRTIPGHNNLSMNDLSDALELTSDDIHEDEKILKGLSNSAI